MSRIPGLIEPRGGYERLLMDVVWGFWRKEKCHDPTHALIPCNWLSDIHAARLDMVSGQCLDRGPSGGNRNRKQPAFEERDPRSGACRGKNRCRRHGSSAGTQSVWSERL